MASGVDTMSPPPVEEWYKRFQVDSEDFEIDARFGRPSTSITDECFKKLRNTIFQVSGEIGISVRVMRSDLY